MRSDYPLLPIPIDRAHEFFSQPLSSHDPAILTWRKHFKAKGVKIVERMEPMGIQFYLHRETIVENGTRHVRWCCASVVQASKPFMTKRRHHESLS
jgi:hypothetical protein